MKILVISPHPDDETLRYGGMIYIIKHIMINGKNERKYLKYYIRFIKRI